MRFRAWDPIKEEFIYSFTNNGKDRLGWFFSNCKHLTIQQSTGLNDMDGCEIFEGDILHLRFGIPPMNAVFEVFFEESAFKVKCRNAKPEIELLYNLKHELDVITIASNIFQEVIKKV